jgi:hypothetical protein
MPMITIQFDDAKVEKVDIQNLADAVQKIVSDVTGIEDVFVYGNSSDIKIKIAPIEIFVEMSANKIANLDSLTESIKEKISIWKRENNFTHRINLSVIPMNWKIEIGI